MKRLKPLLLLPFALALTAFSALAFANNVVAVVRWWRAFAAAGGDTANVPAKAPGLWPWLDWSAVDYSCVTTFIPMLGFACMTVALVKLLAGRRMRAGDFPFFRGSDQLNVALGLFGTLWGIIVIGYFRLDTVGMADLMQCLHTALFSTLMAVVWVFMLDRPLIRPFFTRLLQSCDLAETDDGDLAAAVDRLVVRLGAASDAFDARAKAYEAHFEKRLSDYEREFQARQKEYSEFFARRIAELEKRAESAEGRLSAVASALKACLAAGTILLAAAGTAADLCPRTFCNPLPLENYPLGLFCRGMKNGTKPPREPETWVSEDKLVHQFRELADPSILCDRGKWYLYASGDLCWRSDDFGATWTHIPQKLSGAEGGADLINYAPTICRHRGKYLLIGGAGHVFQAEGPEGPFKDLGPLKLPMWGKDWNWITGSPPGLWDPNFFSDDDGRLYFYWGCSPTNGIWGVEVDAENPLKLVSTPKRVIPFEPRTQPWEIAPGKSPEMGYVEGAWMIKHDGKYILTYAAAGTENREYAMGQALGTSPMGPFVKPKNNPFFKKTTGFITGTSHGSVAKGPDGGWWVAYTINANCSHWFERRIGLDRIEFDADGSLKVTQATDEPQWLPGCGKGATGWKRLVAKTEPAAAAAATDQKFKTYWQPETLPASLDVSLGGLKTVRACRLIWHDGDLDTENGVKKGPYRYRVEFATPEGGWKTLVDARDNARDLLVDYRETDEVRTDRLRLTVLGGPKGIKPGVVDFSPFGD